MNEVVITALPHPITTFVLGTMIVLAVITWIYLSRVMNKLDSLEKENQELKEKVSNNFKITEKMGQEISRKVDSRIDKALGSLKR
jgi:Tfp pilus assembly protein PilO